MYKYVSNVAFMVSIYYGSTAYENHQTFGQIRQYLNVMITFCHVTVTETTL